MLAFNHIGSLGRLGNQMFEYAALRGIASRRGYDWCIPPPDRKGIENYSLHDCFKLAPNVKEGLIENNRYAQEPHFHFSWELFDNCPDNVSLHGFFQSWRYFNHINDEIKRDFTFHDEHLIPCQEMIESVQEPIMLHVRRGDPNLTDPRGFKWSYTQCGSMHPVQPIEYYEKAICLFPFDQGVIVLSYYI